MALKQVKEGTTANLTVTFLNKAGLQDIPESATWEAHDLLTSGLGEELQAATAITPIAAQVEIVIPPAVNVILRGSPREKRRITVKGVYGVNDAVNDQYDYEVINLSKVT